MEEEEAVVEEVAIEGEEVAVKLDVEEAVRPVAAAPRLGRTRPGA